MDIQVFDGTEMCRASYNDDLSDGSDVSNCDDYVKNDVIRQWDLSDVDRLFDDLQGDRSSLTAISEMFSLPDLDIGREFNVNLSFQSNADNNCPYSISSVCHRTAAGQERLLIPIGGNVESSLQNSWNTAVENSDFIAACTSIGVFPEEEMERNGSPAMKRKREQFDVDGSNICPDETLELESTDTVKKIRWQHLSEADDNNYVGNPNDRQAAETDAAQPYTQSSGSTLDTCRPVAGKQPASAESSTFQRRHSALVQRDIFNDRQFQAQSAHCQSSTACSDDTSSAHSRFARCVSTSQFSESSVVDTSSLSIMTSNIEDCDLWKNPACIDSRCSEPSLSEELWDSLPFSLPDLPTSSSAHRHEVEEKSDAGLATADDSDVSFDLNCLPQNTAETTVNPSAMTRLQPSETEKPTATAARSPIAAAGSPVSTPLISYSQLPYSARSPDDPAVPMTEVPVTVYQQWQQMQGSPLLLHGSDRTALSGVPVPTTPNGNCSNNFILIAEQKAVLQNHSGPTGRGKEQLFALNHHFSPGPTSSQVSSPLIHDCRSPYNTNPFSGCFSSTATLAAAAAQPPPSSPSILYPPPFTSLQQPGLIATRFLVPPLLAVSLSTSFDRSVAPMFVWTSTGRPNGAAVETSSSTIATQKASAEEVVPDQQYQQHQRQQQQQQQQPLQDLAIASNTSCSSGRSQPTKIALSDKIRRKIEMKRAGNVVSLAAEGSTMSSVTLVSSTSSSGISSSSSRSNSRCGSVDSIQSPLQDHQHQLVVTSSVSAVDVDVIATANGTGRDCGSDVTKQCSLHNKNCGNDRTTSSICRESLSVNGRVDEMRKEDRAVISPGCSSNVDKLNNKRFDFIPWRDWKGFRFSLDAPVSRLTSPKDERITYLNKGKYYRLSLECLDGYRQQGGSVLQSVVMVQFRDSTVVADEMEAWRLWHSRQPSYKQRILDIDYKNSCGLGPSSIREVAYNAAAVSWNPSNQPVKVNVCVNCLSTDFSTQKGVKGIPLLIHIDTYDGDGPNAQRIHQAACRIKVFCEKGAERKMRDEVRKKRHVKKGKESKEDFADAEENADDAYNFYTVAENGRTPILFMPYNDLPLSTATKLLPQSRNINSNLVSINGRQNDGQDYASHCCETMSEDGNCVVCGKAYEKPAVLLYIRRQLDAKFTPVHLQTAKIANLLASVQDLCGVSVKQISNVFKRSKRGIIVRMDEQILRHYSNESAFVISLVPTSSVSSSIRTSDVIYDVVLTETDGPDFVYK